MDFLLILGKFTRVPNDMFAKIDLLWFQFEMDRRTAKNFDLKCIKLFKISLFTAVF